MNGSLIPSRRLCTKCRLWIRGFSSDSISAAFQQPETHDRKKLQPHAFSEFSLKFLGTGGANVSKFRGMPSSLLELGGESWIFDAGEGTNRQKQFLASTLNTSRLFITHLHMDHVLGLASVLLSNLAGAGVNEMDSPVNVYGPQGLHQLLCTIFKLTDSAIPRKLIINELIVDDSDMWVWAKRRNPWGKRMATDFQHSPARDHQLPTRGALHDDIERRELRSDGRNTWTCVDDSRITVQAGLISHRIPCFGYVVTEADKSGTLQMEPIRKYNLHYSAFQALKNGEDVKADDGTCIRSIDVVTGSLPGRKLVIVGDTSDASTISHLAMNCDILVHEATCEKEREDVALKKGHSTPTMAAKLAKQVKAKRLILNHIGSRYLPMTFHAASNHSNSHDQNGGGGAAEVKSDSELLKEAAWELGRRFHVAVARDFSEISIPVGGFVSAVDATNVEGSFPMFNEYTSYSAGKLMSLQHMSRKHLEANVTAKGFSLSSSIPPVMTHSPGTIKKNVSNDNRESNATRSPSQINGGVLLENSSTRSNSKKQPVRSSQVDQKVAANEKLNSKWSTNLPLDKQASFPFSKLK